jgi:hypothetical protein
MRFPRRSIGFATVLFLISMAVASASASTLAESTADLGATTIDTYAGQSFTTVGTGSYDDITFNFFNGSADYAIGTGYLLSQAYNGIPGGLSSSTLGFLGSATASGGVYDFNSALTLVAGQQYFFYEDTIIPTGSVTGDGVYAGGAGYSDFSSTNDFAGFGQSYDFLVTGQAAATPEPSTFALLGTGLLGFFGATRRRFVP